MGEGAKLLFRDPTLKEIDANDARIDNWVIKEGGDHICDSVSVGSSFEEDSANSVASSSSSDLVEDASSSSSSSSSPSLYKGPLYELSELMAQLPIKRGLSKYYQGKSQSFTSLASVKSVEDLAKRGGTIPYRKKMKSCKSYGGGLDGQKFYTTPKATISKKTSRGSFLSSLGNRGTLMNTCNPLQSCTK